MATRIWPPNQTYHTGLLRAEAARARAAWHQSLRDEERAPSPPPPSGGGGREDHNRLTNSVARVQDPNLLLFLAEVLDGKE